MNGWICCAVVCLTATAGPIIGKVTFENFKYRGDGYLMTGKKAVRTGDSVVVEDARLILDKDDVVLVTSPTVKINLTTGRASGKEKVRIRSRKYIITGNRFDMNIEQERMFIRNVRVVLFQGTQ